MREELAKRENLRGVFTATFCRPGQRTSFGHVVHTLLFLEVQDSAGNVVTDHIWFTAAKCWQKLNLQPSQKVQFCARVKEYWKGYHTDRTRDFKLSHPTDIRIILPRDPSDQSDNSESNIQNSTLVFDPPPASFSIQPDLL